VKVQYSSGLNKQRYAGPVMVQYYSGLNKQRYAGPGMVQGLWSGNRDMQDQGLYRVCGLVTEICRTRDGTGSGSLVTEICRTRDGTVVL
jgi:hypothetical protein